MASNQPSNMAHSLSDKHTSCYPSLCLFLLFGIILFILSSFFTNKTTNDNTNHNYMEYGLYDTLRDDFTNEKLKITTSTCAENDMACRQWYLQNIVNVEMFSDASSSQDCIIDTVFSLGKITFPIYIKPFKQIPKIATADVAIRTSRHVVNSIEHIEKVMRNTFTQLEVIIDTSTDLFDPYIATCTTQITMSSVLFEMYKTLTSMFFLPLSYSNVPSQQSILTMLYLMPVMMYLKTHISGLIESILMILTKNPTNKLDVSSINSSVFGKVKSNITKEVSMIMNTQLSDNNSSDNTNVPPEFITYQSILKEAVITVLSVCRSKIQDVQNLTSYDQSIRTIINGDLIHVFYRSFQYFYLILKIISGTANVPEYNIAYVQLYEKIAYRILSRTDPIPVFNERPREIQFVNIDTPLNTYTTVADLRSALLQIASSIDVSLLNTLAKYNAPGNIGTVFMQVLTSKSEVLSMQISLAQDYLYEYMKTLPESYLQSFLPFVNKTEQKIEGFQSSCQKSSDKRFSIGKCINSSVRQGKQRAYNKNSYTPRYDMFGDNYTVGSLNGSPNMIKDVLIDANGKSVLDSNGNAVLLGSASYDTSGTYLIDSKRNVIYDSSNNPVRSADYIYATGSKKKQSVVIGNASYVPALDSPYPTLQSQLGKAAYDIRGIPDTPLSFAPISGLPGRPVT